MSQEVLASGTIKPKPSMKYTSFFLEYAVQFVLKKKPFVRCENGIISEASIQKGGGRLGRVKVSRCTSLGMMHFVLVELAVVIMCILCC